MMRMKIDKLHIKDDTSYYDSDGFEYYDDLSNYI